MTETTSFDGTRLVLTECGPVDAPVVVLVNGLGLSARSWDRVSERLASEHRVVGYDLRGHGRSGPAPRGDYSMSAHARDLAVVLDRAVLDGRRAVLVGNSLGGGIILAHVHGSADRRVGGVVFAGSGGSGVTAPGLPASALPGWARRSLRSGWLQLLRGAALLGRHIRPVRSITNRIVRRVAFTPESPEHAVDQVRDDFLATRPRALARSTLASVSHDGVDWAPDLDVPALVLHGDRDPEVPPQEVERLMAALPRAERVTIPGAGHMLPLTHDEEVADHVARWVRHVEIDPAPYGPG